MSESVRGLSSSSSSKLALDDAISTKNPQSNVTCVYQTHIGGYWRKVTVIWNKNMMIHSLSITVDSVESDDHPTCKIDLKPWHFWAKKGYKTFEVDGNQLETYWDLCSAKFTGSPEPSGDYYVALVSDEEVVMLLGDYKKKAYKRTKSRPALVDAVMTYKKEHVFGKKSFSTRAKLDHKMKECDIVVESSTTGLKDPEMWISIDGIVLIHVKNLQWKFRGNQTVMVNKLPVQVFWDVHNWLFCLPGSGTDHGLFIFKPEGTGAGPAGEGTEGSDVDGGSSSAGGGGDSECGSTDSKYYSTQSHSSSTPFSLFLYAWKLE